MPQTESITLSPFKNTDIHDLVKWLSDKEIYNNTLRIPFPYTEDDAHKWISFTNASKSRNGKYLNLSLRNANGHVVGGIGFVLPEIAQLHHQGEIGYWIAKPYRNKGIITQAVKMMCNYGFEELNLVRITAHIFTHNLASEKVLIKAGFKFEGEFEKFYYKNGEYINARLYALVK